jgi:hypothetical protein
MPPRGSFPDLQKCIEAFHYFLAHKPAFLLNSSALYSKHWDFVYDFCQGRALITTMEGYIGLAPKTTKAGHVVSMLLGSDAPLAFRPTESGKYKLVGRYYVYGLMDSEALLGSTDHFQFG